MEELNITGLTPRIHFATCTGHSSAIYALEKGRTPKHFLTSGGDGWIVEWDADEPEIGQLLAKIETQVFSLLHLPEKQKIIAGTMNGSLHFIDLANPNHTKSTQHHGKKAIFQILKTDFGIFTLGGDGVLTRWDETCAKPTESLKISSQALRCAAILPSGKEIVVGSSDHSIYIIDCEALSVLSVTPEAHANSVFSLANSIPGNYLLSGGRDAMLKIWEIGGTLKRLEEIPAHLFSINDIKFSPDGQRFATASRDKTIKIWDFGKCQLLKVLDAARQAGHSRSVNKILWQKNFLVSGSDDRTAKIWSVDNIYKKPEFDVFAPTH